MTMDQLIDSLRDHPRNEAELVKLGHLARKVPIHDMAYLMKTLPTEQAAIVYRVLEKDTALAVFESLSPATQAELIAELRHGEIFEIFNELDPDDRASLFDELPAKVADRLMSGLDLEQRTMTTTVLGYPEDAIGRYMSPEVLWLHPEWTVRRAIDHVKAHIDEPETIYLLPVLDDSRILLGVTGLRRLLSSDDDMTVREIMREAESAHATDPREETARRFLGGKLLAMPIVDAEHRLLGVLTYDDAVEIINEEDAEDAARSGGAEPLEKSYLSSSIMRIVQSRVVWLVMLALSAALTVKVLDLFEDKLSTVVILALFIPLLTGTGGNTGNQAATTVTRALAVGEVRIRDLPKVIWRELRVGFVLGLILGSLAFVITGFIYGFTFGTVIGLTLLAVCVQAAVVGGMMPIIAKKIGADPAVFSNPFISTFCDATGLLIYFGIASVILGI